MELVGEHDEASRHGIGVDRIVRCNHGARHYHLQKHHPKFHIDDRLIDFVIYKKIVKFSSATKVIVVGGTNGKGSTVEFLTQLLIFSKRKVGTFTSPHLLNLMNVLKLMAYQFLTK